MAAAETWTPDIQKQENLDMALKEYGENLADRATGHARSGLTLQSHTTAVKTFLKGLSEEEVKALENIGKKNGKINKLLEEKK